MATHIANITNLHQENQYLANNSRGQGGPQEVSYNAASQEDRPPFPSWPGSYSTQPQGRHHQGCLRCHLQGVQEAGEYAL